MKKFIFGSIIGIGIIFVSIYYVMNRHQLPVDSVFKAIPLDASVIIDIKDYNNFRNSLDANNPLWKSLSSICFFNEIESKLFLLDSLKKKYPNLKTLFSTNPEIFVSFHPFGKDEFMPIYYLKMTSSSGVHNFKKLFGTMEGSDITERDYQGETIRDIILPANKGNFSCAFIKGLLIVSKSSILVENVVRQLGAQESIIQKKGLDELTKSAGKNYPVNIYLRLDALPRILNNAIYSQYNNALQFISNLGGWTELDLNIKKDLFVLNGFTAPGDNQEGLFTIFANQNPQKLELFTKIPSDAVSVVAMGISNLDSYWSNYQKYLEHIGLWKSYALRRDSIQLKYPFDLKEDFKSIFDSECGVVITAGTMDSLSSCSYSLIRVKSADDTEKMLDGWIKKYADSTDTKPGKYLSEIKLDEEISLKVFHFPAGNIPEALLGDVFGASSNAYCVLYDNYLVFGCSPEALKDYIRYEILNNTLSTNLEFNRLSDNFSSSSNFFFYFQPSAPIGFYTHFLKPEITNNLNKHLISLHSVHSIIYQFSINNKSLIYNNILIKGYSGTFTESPKTTWESQLDSKVVLRPLFLKSNSSSESQIFVQDDKNTVYLLNNTGRILWKQKLDEPILSDIFPIDYYRNRKLQYCFNTRSKIYLIDRLGNNVENYPVNFSEPASNGIAVFDYDKNRKYRIFYAGEDRKIYLLDKDAEVQNGWNFGKTETRVSKSLQHFENANTDYLVFSDNSHIYIVNRKGVVKIKPSAYFPLSKNNSVYFIPKNKKHEEQFVATDTTGIIHFINTKGEVTDLNLGRFPSNHFFDIQDLNADNSPDFVFGYNRQLKGFDKDKSEILSIETDHPFIMRPIFFEFASRKIEIGLTSPENEKIYLFDTSGNLHKGFPLKGSTQFSVELLNNSENRFNLIVGSGNNFLYNYSVQ